VSDPAGYTIGQLARRTGVPVRTIRFWSDAGVVPCVGRSASGYRLYDAAAVARLDLVQTLRELGLGLDTVRRTLTQALTIVEVADAHVTALDTEIRTLRVRRAVLRTVARRASSIEETLLMHKLARLSAQERQHIIDEFVDRAFAGTDLSPTGTRTAESMRQLPATLADDPTPEQVDAWIELADLVDDSEFQQRVRQMALEDARLLPTGPDGAARQTWPRKSTVMEHAGRAVADGVAPDSTQGRTVLDRIITLDNAMGSRDRMLEQLEMFTDSRVERYLQLTAIINGRTPSPTRSAAFEWLIAALRANPS